MINNKITVKERKRAADLLAIKAGRTRRNSDDVSAAAAMSEDAIKELLKCDDITPAAALQVDEIKPGALDASGDLFALSEDLIKNICDKYDLSADMSPLQWSFVCSRVGSWFRSRSAFRQEQKNCIASNNMQEFNIDALAAALPVWVDLCSLYNKIPFKTDFCAFVGMSHGALYKQKNNGVLTSGGVDLFKMLDDLNADGLRKKAVNPKESPIGAIFLLKADHGLVEAQKIQHEYIKTDASGAALPVFGADPVQIDENGIK